MPARNESTPFLAQVSLVPPAEQELPIDPVRSTTIITCAGNGLPPPSFAVDVTETVAELIPTTRANTVFTDADCVTVTAFGVLAVLHHGGMLPFTVRHLGVNDSVTALMSEPLFFWVEAAPYVVAFASA